ncbi:dedicator of cytokinesis protein 1-like [Halichondria panicea]|uniref:dedicator of cytokinesis protein 1-like n=1 Tax=Halichondria panicea TaxID=6063 RepID=UPI00312BC915
MEANGAWRPTKNAKYGVVVYSYEPQKVTYPFLRLQLGDVVQILEENAGWYRGFCIRDKHNKGIFPASHVHLKDCTLQNSGPDEVVLPKEESVVKEISDVLREWSVIWRRLYAEGKRLQFQELTQLMRDLLDRRRQIQSKTLPRDELKELKLFVASKIDYGNRLLTLDLVPRDESGAPINPKTAGVMQLYSVIKQVSQQQSSSDSVANKRKSYMQITTQPNSTQKDEHHIFLKFSALALQVNEPCELYFFLYDARQSKTLSERYVISLSQHCLPRDAEKINQCFAVFTDIDSTDLTNKNLYLACQIIRFGNHLENKATTNPLRKAHGAAVWPLHELLEASQNGDLDEKDLQMDVYTCPPVEYHKLLDSIIKKQGIFNPTDKGNGVFISLKPLKGTMAKVKEENPLLFRKFTAECHKLYFPEIIRPYDVRHDVYLTMVSGVFTKGTKRADKNVEINVEILDDRDIVIPNCIAAGIGEPCTSSYTSLVQYHCATPVFNETMKLHIPPELMPKARVRFSMYHKSTIISSRLNKNEPYAIAHLKLMKDDDTTIEDGQHELYVYKYKETARGAYKYTSLPCINEAGTPQIVNNDLLSPRDSFLLRTKICSTKLTQHGDLHRLLHWRQNVERLPSILTAMSKVPGDEIVKFLSDTFNALFSIMEEMAEEVGELVFEALVFIIGLLAVEKYENFRPVLDSYCDKNFQAATVHSHLVAKMKWVFDQVMILDGGRRLRGDIIQKTLKAAEFLVKFIMKSRALFEQGTRGKGSETFRQSVHSLLTTICELMGLECGENELIAPRAQAQALQFLPATFDLFLSVLSVDSLGAIVAKLLNNLRETKLKIYKSVFVSAVVSSKLFQEKESRVLVLPAILRHLRYHISNRDDLLDKCLTVLGAIMKQLHDQDPALVDEEVNVVVQSMLHTLLECFTSLTERMDKVPPTVGHCVVVLMAVLEQMTPRHYQQLRLSLMDTSNTESVDLGEFILCTFNAFCELAALNLYANVWTVLKLQLNYVILRTTNALSRILVEDFLGSGENDAVAVTFNPSLWQNFFQLAVAFTCQYPLQLEVMSEVKMNRVLTSYGDMRIAMNSLMVSKWQALGNYQGRYVPGMIGPFLKVSLIPHNSIRRTTIPIFFDMMENEFKYRKNFHMMETEMIDKLDLYISGGNGDSKYRQLLYHMLSERCKTHPHMDREAGMQFIESLAELLRRLLDYRTVQQGDRDLHMHVMFNLLNFYKEMGREEIYIRYIYHLAELHKSIGSWVEAGFTLLLHAQLLQWSQQMQKQEGQYPKQSSADRKECLYHDIIDYFDKGKLWECGIEQCKEIASQLETVTFNFEKLSETHNTIARFYSNIVREIRAESEYFRVGFYGGFPPFLKSKVFIFRGHEYEKLADFNSRMSNLFPNAKFMKSLEPPGLDIIESTEQHIQSCSVEPIPERETMSMFDGKNVTESIVRFYHTNYVRRFMLKRPFHRGQKDKSNEYKTLHTECTVYTTAHRFPGILRWFEVVDTEVIVKNPVENGIEMVLDNVQQLKTVINRIRSDPSQSTNPLTMKLNGTLDAAVNGGVSKFDVFFTQEFLESNPRCKPLLAKLKKYKEDLCKACEEGVALHAQVGPESMKELHRRMEELLEDYRARYGGGFSAQEDPYDPVTFSEPEFKRDRLLSSAGPRRDKFRKSDRSTTISSGRPPSFHEKSLESSGSPVLRRDRSATSANDLGSDYDIAGSFQKHRQFGSGSRLEPPAPPVPTHKAETPPAPPMRRNIIPQGSVISMSSVVLVDESPPPAPPRSTSVRMSMSRKDSSREDSPASTPVDGNTPVSSLRDLSEPQVPNNQEAGAENPTSTSPDVPPALPAKKARRGNSVQVLQGGPPTDESTS